MWFIYAWIGALKKQNYWIWHNSNPHEVQKRPMHPVKITVCYGYWTGGIVGQAIMLTNIIGYYNLSVRIRTLLLPQLMLCALILYIGGGIYSLKSTPNDRFFEKLFMAILFTLRVFVRNLLRGNRRRNTFHISFWCLDWNPGFSSNKPTHYLLDHGDFRLIMENNFIQIAASVGHAVGYTIGLIFKHIIDCVQLYFTNGFTNIVL